MPPPPAPPSHDAGIPAALARTNRVSARAPGGYCLRVTRVVVLSSSEIDRAALADVVSPDDELFVVVPAVKQSRLQWLFNDEDKARAEARVVGEAIARSAPADASEIEVKPDPPEQAVLDVIAEHRPDRIVVALREGDDATWLEGEGTDQLPRLIDGVPVDHIRL